VVELVDTLVKSQSPPARVCLLGGDSLLAYALQELGYEVTLWHFSVGHLTDDLLERVDRTLNIEQLNGGADFEANFRRRSWCAWLESLPSDPVAFLSSVRRALTPTGTLILATTNARRLDIRLLTLLGRDTTSAYPQFHVSFSFPPLPRLRYYQAQELERTVKKAGLWSRERRFILSHSAYSDIDPHPPGRFLKLIFQHWTMRLLARTRPTILLRLTRRAGDHQLPESTRSSSRAVSVILSARRGQPDLEKTLGAILKQEFAAADYEVIVVHDGKLPERTRWIEAAGAGSPVQVRELIHDPPEGPDARNAATQAAEGHLCAHTDDGCRIPLGWLPTIAAAFDDTAGVVSGPVVDEPGSHLPFLTLPGSRPGWDQRGLYPISNVAYRRSAFLASGGFSVPHESNHSPPLLWDTELAWRLQRMGWEARYLKHLFMYRSYPPPRRFSWFATQWKLARDLPLGVKRTPGLAKELLTAGGFASNTTLYFDLLILGILAAVAARSWLPLLLATPYLIHYSHFIDLWPVSQWTPSLRLVIGAGIRHVIWLSGLLWGSLRARRIVL
jgi:glycosyltransferase involved in cell wall biosynthesis